LPSQEGRDQPFLELENQELALAEVKDAPPAPEAPPSQPAPPQPPQPEQTEESRPEEKTPQEPEPDALIAAAQPEEKNETEQPPPPAQPAARPSFQRQARPTRLSGSVSNRGRAAVAALATPLGRYRKAISDAIGSSWYHHIGSRMDLVSYGTVSVVFIIDRHGKARRPRVISNSSNESFEIVTLQSILAAEIPPIPPDILPTLEGGEIEIDYTFSIITN
jgi:outer membrane biosynthesis protein TonB